MTNEQIEALKEENAVLRERLAAICSFAYGNVKMHNAALNKSDIDKAIDSMVADIVALRADKERLDRLEWELRGLMFRNITIETDANDITAVFGNPRTQEEGREFHTDRGLRGALDRAFAHLDAARKGGS